jgi:hypothetical protein
MSELIHITDEEGKVIETWISPGAMYEGMNNRIKYLQAKRHREKRNALWKGFFIGAAVIGIVHILLFLTFKFLL